MRTAEGSACPEASSPCLGSEGILDGFDRHHANPIKCRYASSSEGRVTVELTQLPQPWVDRCLISSVGWSVCSTWRTVPSIHRTVAAEFTCAVKRAGESIAANRPPAMTARPVR